MLVISEDDKNAPPLLAKWSQSSLWICDVLNNPEIAEHLPQDVKEKGWNLIQQYERHTGLM